VLLSHRLHLPATVANRSERAARPMVKGTLFPGSPSHRLRILNLCRSSTNSPQTSQLRTLCALTAVPGKSSEAKRRPRPPHQDRPSGDDLYIVDQHTAHERVLYEEMQNRIEASSVDGQSLLFPVQIELSPEQLAVFEEAAELLTNSGFAVSEFGGRMINIESVPTVLAKKSPEKVVRAVLDDLGSERKTGTDLKKAMAQSMACRAAVMSGDRLSDREAEGLLEQLLRCRDKYSCPHGRPTFIKISRQDLDRQFGRE